MSFICGTDFGEEAVRAMEIAARLAAKAGHPLTLVHSLEMPALAYMAGEPIFLPVRTPAISAKELQLEADIMLGAEAKTLASTTGAKVIPRLTIGSPAQAILETAADQKPDLIVTGTRGRSAPARWLLGSTADRLVRRAADPLLVVRGPAEGLLAWTRGKNVLKVLVGVSFDDSFEYAALAAKALAKWGPCEVYIAYAQAPQMAFYEGATSLHAPLTPIDLHASTVRAVHHLAADRGLTVPEDRVRVLVGPPPSVLVDEAASGAYDLIVVGTHSRKGLERALLGSVALGILHHAPCPVLIAPVI